ncbi:acyltransferase family protein [Streptomyces sp. ODS05-4]|uniref:acyltransferase family protein n=1 Tax=Streptomyces sp. ODS05-4 TaxID=2944939 RepID=UPI00210D722F|nr:acyltransferase family protein [Streptomyces sp. ODS05-4]
MFQAPHGNPKTPLPPVEDPASAAANPPPHGVDRAARPAGGDAAGSAGPARRARDPFFDNAKYLAIVLVAIAHSWELVMDGSRTTRAVYMVVYTFHMPAFILVSGYFSRSFAGRPDQVKRLLTGLVVPYLVFETAYTLFASWATGDWDRSLSLTDPFYLTWFLVALFLWRLSVPLWRSLKYPLAVSMAVAVTASLSPATGSDLDLMRVLQFLPFFVLGLLMKPEHFDLVRRRAARIAAVPVLLAALLFAYWIAPGMKLSWFYRASPVEDMGMAWWTAPVMLVLLTGCALVLTAAFLALVPQRRTWFTALGAGTITGYLLHGFGVKALDYWHVVDRQDWLASPAGRVVLTVAAATVVTLACTSPVRRALRWVTEPRMDWAFKEDPAKAAAARRQTAPAAPRPGRERHEGDEGHDEAAASRTLQLSRAGGGRD